MEFETRPAELIDQLNLWEILDVTTDHTDREFPTFLKLSPRGGNRGLAYTQRIDSQRHIWANSPAAIGSEIVLSNGIALRTVSVDGKLRVEVNPFR
jgi:hypothetical protein